MCIYISTLIHRELQENKSITMIVTLNNSNMYNSSFFIQTMSNEFIIWELNKPHHSIIETHNL